MMVIPKKIHWCWLSGDPLPPRIQRCVDSWRKNMPDYEIVLWDMKRFDIHSVPFVEQACAAKKWAFAADYIRWYALYTEGGIYLDSDVKVYRRLDKFLQHQAFSAVCYFHQATPEGTREEKYSLEAECIGSEKGHPLMKRCLDTYKNKNFRMTNGVVDMGVAPVVLSNACMLYGWNNSKHVDKPLYLKEGIVVYPEKYFTFIAGEFSLRHTHTLHLAMNSWVSDFVYKQDILLPLRKWHHYMMGRYWFFPRLHYKRKHLEKKVKRFLSHLKLLIFALNKRKS
ncbi:MAG: hypothetical protein LBS55_09270 [Prevotellaceae bacterium]|jgi:hypothetical protein|nr:hypothetical protein [Prevotellaceae bacterium]